MIFSEIQVRSTLESRGFRCGPLLKAVDLGAVHSKAVDLGAIHSRNKFEHTSVDFKIIRTMK